MLCCAVLSSSYLITLVPIFVASVDWTILSLLSHHHHYHHPLFLLITSPYHPPAPSSSPPYHLIKSSIIPITPPPPYHLTLSPTNITIPSSPPHLILSSPPSPPPYHLILSSTNITHPLPPPYPPPAGASTSPRPVMLPSTTRRVLPPLHLLTRIPHTTRRCHHTQVMMLYQPIHSFIHEFTGWTILAILCYV